MMDFIRLESELAVAADASIEDMVAQFSSTNVSRIVWLTDDVCPEHAKLQNVAFPKVNEPNESLLAPVVEAIHSINIDESEAPETLVASSSHNFLGIWLAFYLMQNGAAPVHAVARVRASFPQCFEEKGWDQFVYDVLYQLQE